MSNEETDDDDELGFPQRFLDDAEELARQTTDGDAWAKFMYGQWFVCPTQKLKSTLEISLLRRRSYVTFGTDTSDRLDVLVDSPNLLEEANSGDFELPHVSLHDLIASSINHLMDYSSGSPVLGDGDKPEVEKLIRDIEATVASAIAELRLFICGGAE